MVLHVISPDKSLLEEIADYLLTERLITHAMLSNSFTFKTRSGSGSIRSASEYSLQGISKSLLFGKINQKLRDKYHDAMPLLYSEPIILIDPIQTETIAQSLLKI